MSDQFGNSDDDLDRGDYLLEQQRDRQMMADMEAQVARKRQRDRFSAMADALGGAEAMARVLGFSEFEELLGEHRSTCLRAADRAQAAIREKAQAGDAS